MSIEDIEGDLYYAQLRGFLQDQYAQKTAVITWLIPMVPKPSYFDPAVFLPGERFVQNNYKLGIFLFKRQAAVVFSLDSLMLFRGNMESALMMYLSNNTTIKDPFQAFRFIYWCSYLVVFIVRFQS